MERNPFAATTMLQRSWVSHHFSFSFLAYNFASLDAVFFEECPICAINMKAMWCSFACNSEQASFMNLTGYETYWGMDFAVITYTMTPDYACEVFQSCQQESLIQESGLTSSLGFMDFMGVNGMNQSMSILTFNFTNDTTVALDGYAYPCNYAVPSDGIV